MFQLDHTSGVGTKIITKTNIPEESKFHLKHSFLALRKIFIGMSTNLTNCKGSYQLYRLFPKNIGWIVDDRF